MANANAKRYEALSLFGDAEADQKLGQIMTLLSDRSKITPAMLRIKLWAICEGIDVPGEMKAFVALADRAGVGYNRRYSTWALMCGDRAIEGPADADVIPLKAETALYRWHDADDVLLYVGIAGNLGSRVKGHVKGSSWMEFVARSAVERRSSRGAALEAEEAAIKAEHPIFNYQHNNTPEARERLVEYLTEHDRLDLLMPAVERG